MRALQKALDLNNAEHIILWTACCVGFFLFFMRGNLLSTPRSTQKFMYLSAVYKLVDYRIHRISRSTTTVQKLTHSVRVVASVVRLSAVSVQDGGVFERGPKICSFSTLTCFYIDVFVVFVFIHRYVKLNSGKVGRNSRREATEGDSTSE